MLRLCPGPTRCAHLQEGPSHFSARAHDLRQLDAAATCTTEAGLDLKANKSKMLGCMFGEVSVSSSRLPWTSWHTSQPSTGYQSERRSVGFVRQPFLVPSRDIWRVGGAELMHPARRRCDLPTAIHSTYCNRDDSWFSTRDPVCFYYYAVHNTVIVENKHGNLYNRIHVRERLPWQTDSTDHSRLVLSRRVPWNTEYYV